MPIGADSAGNWRLSSKDNGPQQMCRNGILAEPHRHQLVTAEMARRGSGCGAAHGSRSGRYGVAFGAATVQRPRGRREGDSFAVDPATDIIER